MPTTLFDVVADRRTASFDVHGHQVTVTYRPNSLTPAREVAILRQSAEDVTDDELEDLARAESLVTRQVETFAELVESWDLYGPLAVKDGARLEIPQEQRETARDWVEAQGGRLLAAHDQPVPINGECLRLIPSYFLVSLVEKINQDMRPDPKRRRS